jgi:S-layer protein
VATKVQLAAGASLDSYANAAAAAAHAASARGGLAWFQHGGDSFIVQDVNGNGSFDGGADVLVKLTGLRDLGNALFDPAQSGSLALA